MCVCVCVCACVHVCAYEVTLGAIPHEHPSCSRFLSDQELTDWAPLASDPQGFVWLCLPRTEITYTTMGFYMGSNLIQIPMFP